MMKSQFFKRRIAGSRIPLLFNKLLIMALDLIASIAIFAESGPLIAEVSDW
jgi:hypothetical protein